MAISDRGNPLDADLERLLADAFRRVSWRVHRCRSGRDVKPDLIVDGDGEKYLIEFKRSSEGRSDRLIPLLSQAILQAQSVRPTVPRAHGSGCRRSR